MKDTVERLSASLCWLPLYRISMLCYNICSAYYRSTQQHNPTPARRLLHRVSVFRSGFVHTFKLGSARVHSPLHDPRIDTRWAESTGPEQRFSVADTLGEFFGVLGGLLPPELGDTLESPPHQHGCPLC